MGLTRVVITIISIAIAVLALLQSPLKDHPLIAKLYQPSSSVSPLESSINMTQNVTRRRPPTYFFSHGGVSLPPFPKTQRAGPG
jgi:hypothetical protein